MYEYKINSMEVYKSESLTPQIAADVMAYNEDGIMLVHKTVVFNALELDKQIVDKDDALQVEEKLTAEMVKTDSLLTVEYLDKLDADQKAKEQAWLDAQVILDKIQAKLLQKEVVAIK